MKTEMEKEKEKETAKTREEKMDRVKEIGTDVEKENLHLITVHSISMKFKVNKFYRYNSI